MEDKIGQILEGEVTHVASFGAFVKFPDTEDGLIHISEIANEFVTDIHQFVKKGDKVKVKVLGRNQKNKLELSIKRIQTAASPVRPTKTAEPVYVPDAVQELEVASFSVNKSKNMGFEDRLTRFLKQSEEKQIDLRRSLKQKQGIAKKRKSS